MVGVVFLLYSDKKADEALIKLMVDQLGFTQVSLPILSLEDLQLALTDKEKFAAKKQELVRALDFAHKDFKKNWNNNYVIYPVYFKEQLEFAHNRTYYLPFRVEMPILEKFKHSGEGQDLESYLKIDGLLNFDFLEGFKPKLIHRLTTSEYSVPALYDRFMEHDSTKIILSKDIRMEVDTYFMNIAYVVRKRSNCMKRSVGCVLVKNKRIVSVGYNGCPQSLPNCFEGGCERCNSDCKQGVDLHKCYCLHAEESAILECGIHNSVGATLYCTLFPCLWCSKIMVHAKINHLYYCEDYDSAPSVKCLQDSGVIIEKIDPSRIDMS